MEDDGGQFERFFRPPAQAPVSLVLAKRNTLIIFFSLARLSLLIVINQKMNLRLEYQQNFKL